MMDLTHKDKSIIKSVIEGFTYHQKYKLHLELCKDLKEDSEFATLLKKTEPFIEDLKADDKLKETLKSGTDKINTVLKPKKGKK